MANTAKAPMSDLMNLVYPPGSAASAAEPNAERPPSPVTIDDVRAAASRIQGEAHHTPVLTSRAIDRLSGRDLRVFFKCENFQRIGAFKFRGAFNALSTLDEERRARGVMTYSSGNHAQAVALAGRLLRIATVIVMPNNAPRIKYNATREYIDESIGSEIVQYDPNEITREELGARIAAERGLTLVKPYDNPFVIAGQGTVGLELVEQLDRDFGGAKPDIIFVCCGGGGLLSGTSIALKSLCPDCQVVGVEPELADDAFRSFRDRELRTVHNPPTIADGARTPALGQWTFSLVRRNVDTMMTVSDNELRSMMHLVMERMKIVIEPTAALGPAGLFRAATNPGAMIDGRNITGRSIDLDTVKNVAVIISGGNVDLDQLSTLLQIAH